MATLKLYGYPNHRTTKSQVAALYGGVDVQYLGFEFDRSSDDWKARFPTGKLPCMDTPDGPIWESNAIARYVARANPRSNLYGKGYFENAQVDQWLDFAQDELIPPASVWTYPILGYTSYNEQAYKQAKEDLKRGLRVLDDHLLRHTFLVGNNITLADIVVSISLQSTLTMVADSSYRAEFPNVVRWFLTCVNQPNFVSVLGSVTLCDQEQKFNKKGSKPAQAEPPKKNKKKKAKKAAPIDTSGPKSMAYLEIYAVDDAVEWEPVRLKVRALEVAGVTEWSTGVLVDVYGPLKKLKMMATIVRGLDIKTVQEAICGIEGVEEVDVVAVEDDDKL